MKKNTFGGLIGQSLNRGGRKHRFHCTLLHTFVILQVIVGPNISLQQGTSLTAKSTSDGFDGEEDEVEGERYLIR